MIIQVKSLEQCGAYLNSFVSLRKLIRNCYYLFHPRVLCDPAGCLHFTLSKFDLLLWYPRPMPCVFLEHAPHCFTYLISNSQKMHVKPPSLCHYLNIKVKMWSLNSQKLTELDYKLCECIVFLLYSLLHLLHYS